MLLLPWYKSEHTTIFFTLLCSAGLQLEKKSCFTI